MEEREVRSQIVSIRREVLLSQPVEPRLGSVVHEECQYEWRIFVHATELSEAFLNFVFRLRSVFTFCEREVGFGVVGADPASPYHGEPEHEPSR